MKKEAEKILEETIEWFNRHGSRYRVRGWNISFLEKYIKGRTLDLGSGVAATSRRLLYNHVIDQLVLVDLACNTLSLIEDHVFLARICCDMRDESFINESFDTVLLIASLHNIPGRQSRVIVLENAYRILRRNGYLIVFVWARNQLYFIKHILSSIINWLTGRSESIGDIVLKDRKGSIRYYHLYTLKELIEDVRSAGFRVVEKGVYYPRKPRGLMDPVKNYYVVGVKD